MKNTYTINDLLNSKIIKDFANKDLFLKLIANKTKTKRVYCGFDPTAEALHLGNYIQLLMLKKMSIIGFEPIVVIGEGTAMIGDPSGKNQERKLLSYECLKNNAARINSIVRSVLPKANFVNNKEWLGDLKFITTLRDYGKYFNINTMLKKQNIATRLESGISFTEFSYMLLQSVDFYKLYKKYDCYGQIGGSDQWGNIVSGIDLIEKKMNSKVSPFGITFHLLTDENGVKFGKSESGKKIWIDKNLTSPYEMYQFFINQPDKQLFQLFEYFTCNSIEYIQLITQKHLEKPYLRFGQKELAREVIVNLFGNHTLTQVEKITESLFKNTITDLSLDEFCYLSKSLNIVKINISQKLYDILKTSLIVRNSVEYKDIISKKSIKVNDKIIDSSFTFIKNKALFNKYFFVKKGKRYFYILEII